MDSMYKAFEALSKRLDSLDVNIGRKLDLVNVHVKNASQRTTALEMQGMHFKSPICVCIGPLFLKVLEETEDNEQNHQKPFLKGSMVEFHLVGDLGCSSNVHNVP